jgi:hypothetical protein
MKQLRAEDSAEKHRRTSRYHIGACRRSPNIALCTTLRQEAEACYKCLVKATRTFEDAADDLVDLSAEADAVEEALEALLRDFYQDLGRLDRDNPGLDLQDTAFPKGLGEVLEPKGQEQVDAVVHLMNLLKTKQAQPKVAEGLEKLSIACATLQSALGAEEAAEQKVDETAADESAAKKALREQLNSAHGQLRALFKANLAKAERFFLKEAGTRRAAAPAIPATPTPT